MAMQILSTRLLALDKGELRYQADAGQVVHVQTGEESSFTSASGVYFMKMYTEKKFTHPERCACCSADGHELGFVRQGQA